MRRARKCLQRMPSSRWIFNCLLNSSVFHLFTCKCPVNRDCLTSCSLPSMFVWVDLQTASVHFLRTSVCSTSRWRWQLWNVERYAGYRFVCRTISLAGGIYAAGIPIVENIRAWNPAAPVLKWNCWYSVQVLFRSLLCTRPHKKKLTGINAGVFLYCLKWARKLHLSLHGSISSSKTVSQRRALCKEPIFMGLLNYSWGWSKNCFMVSVSSYCGLKTSSGLFYKA